MNIAGEDEARKQEEEKRSKERKQVPQPPKDPFTTIPNPKVLDVIFTPKG